MGERKFLETSYDKTILIEPKESSIISKKEVFGPVVCVYSYDDIDKAIQKANSAEVSFQASIFSNEIKEVLNFYEKKLMPLRYFTTIILHFELIGCHLQDLNIQVMVLEV